MLLTSLSAPLLAQPNNIIDYSNGCGSGWSEKLVPEMWSSLGLDFTHACATHDNCYSNCRHGGVWDGQSICEDEAKLQQHKQACDLTFKDALYGQCMHQSNVKDTVCKAVSGLYYLAASIVGGEFFDLRELDVMLDEMMSNGEEDEAMMKEIENMKHTLMAMMEQANKDNIQQPELGNQSNQTIPNPIIPNQTIPNQIIPNQ